MSEKWPFVSVVMPVRNAGRYIGDAIKSILSQDYPHERMEIVVADGMSEDNTRGVVESYKDRDVDIKIIDNEGLTVPYAMSKLVLSAKGKIIVRLDGHARFPVDYIRTMVNILLSNRADCAGGRLQTIGIGRMGNAIAIAMSSVIGVGASFRTAREDMLVDTVAFGAYWRKDLLRTGEYIPYLTRNSDEEHNYRFREMGKKIIVLSQPEVSYISRGSIGGLFRQMYGYGFYKPVVLYLHPEFLKIRQILPMFFILLIGPFVSSIIWNNIAIFYAILIPVVLYLLAIIGFTLKIMKKGGFVIGLLSGISAVIMHFTYGTGEITGLLKLLILETRGDIKNLKKS
jgi:glycosyltransferase involved in cell wall biosynthesis